MTVIVRSCLFEAAKLTKNDDANKYGYSRYGIGFKACSQFWYSDGMWGENVAIFGVDNNSSVHICNKQKYRYLRSW